MEGLLIGFWLARVRSSQPRGWVIVNHLAPWVVFAAALVLLAVQFVSPVWMYRVGLTALALGFASLLVFVVGHGAGKFVASRFVKGIALASYSVYLTHPLMIHAARKLVEKFPVLPWSAYFPLVFALVVVGGAAFYFTVERTSILLRDRWVPRRIKSGGDSTIQRF
jgi:peptidoglycan/LPS O-acetylase OafA/YrhL